jgi:hypothetical protein
LFSCGRLPKSFVRPKHFFPLLVVPFLVTEGTEQGVHRAAAFDIQTIGYEKPLRVQWMLGGFSH